MIVNDSGRECSTCGLVKPWSEFRKLKKGPRGKAYRCKTCANKSADNWKQLNIDKIKDQRLNVRQYAFYEAKKRANKNKVVFTLTVGDIPLIPEYCPVLGIPLARGTGKPTANSPSLDRIICDEGYIPGNIHWISWRANRLKSDATAKELRMIADYFDKSSSEDLIRTCP